MRGKVYLVGAGPGDPGLLTLKAAALLKTADVVLHDDLVTPEILGLVSRAAEIRNVGKRAGKKNLQQEEINFLMVELAAAGKKVVRLKSGDPSIFGRSGEEMGALKRAGVGFEVVPGVTSALGAAASARIPLTHRERAHAVILVSAHRANRKEQVEWQRFLATGATLVIYMPGRDYSRIADGLLLAGACSELPCAIVSRATQSGETTSMTSLGGLCDTPEMMAPALLIIGDVVGLASGAHEVVEQIPAFATDLHPSQLGALLA